MLDAAREVGVFRPVTLADLAALLVVPADLGEEASLFAFSPLGAAFFLEFVPALFFAPDDAPLAGAALVFAAFAAPPLLTDGRVAADLVVAVAFLALLDADFSAGLAGDLLALGSELAAAFSVDFLALGADLPGLTLFNNLLRTMRETFLELVYEQAVKKTADFMEAFTGPCHEHSA